MGRGRTLSFAAGLIGAVAFALPPAATADSDWAQAALADQYELGSELGLRNAPWVGTHNSFNSTAEMGQTLSAQDSNQRITLSEQLDQGIRSLELDLHWFPSAMAGGNGPQAPVVCHAADLHVGCTVEKPLGPVLDEIAGWLRKRSHRNQVLLLYLEDHLDNAQGYDTAAATIEARLGDLLYRPPSGGCTELPLGLTRDRIRAAGKQVIIVSDCGAGAGWPQVVFSWKRHQETRPRAYRDFPDCGPDFDRKTYDSTLVRYFEDSTQLTAVAGEPDDGITPETAAAMARCGVDLFGLDQLVPDDPRVEALVWSWAPGEPNGGRCAAQVLRKRFPFGRWRAQKCSKLHRVACRKQGRWLVPRTRIVSRAASEVCAEHRATEAVPRTGFEAQRLRLAMKRARTATVWLDFQRRNGDWASG
jgi:phosphatidylinositol-specific phospholipase C-like protein